MIGGNNYGLCFGDRCNRCIRVDNWSLNTNNNCGWFCSIFSGSIRTGTTTQS